MGTTSADVAVVGAGIVGLCTAFALLERRVEVDVYESGVPGNGQSGGESRIFRHAHDDPRLIRAAARSRQLYSIWGELLGTPLLSDDGAVALGPSVRQRMTLLRETGIRARWLNPSELAERIPPLADFDRDAMLDEQGGSIHTIAMIDALTQRVGDRLVADDVLTVRPAGDGSVEVRSGGRTRRYRRVVVCAGRTTARFGRDLGLTLPIRQAAHVRLTFAVQGDPPPMLATLQDSSGAFGETGIYAAATPDRSRYGVGLSETCEVREDGSLLDPDALAELAQRACEYVRRALPGLSSDPVDVRHCWVTELGWGSDGLAVWEAGNVLLVGGHNLFKQAPWLGEKLAAAATGEPLDPDLRPESQLGAG